MEPIRFVAIVQKVQTLADGGLRVTLDLPESAIMQAAELMVCKREAVVLRVECEQEGDGTENQGKSTKIHI